MSITTRFLALSAVYFGLASAVTSPEATAQPATTPGVEVPREGKGADESRAERADKDTQPTRQREFQHPMLDTSQTNEVRKDAGQGIQRRGVEQVKQDGMIQRHVTNEPGSTPGVGPRRAEGTR